MVYCVNDCHETDKLQVEAPFLSLLFQYRVIFNRIAANSTEGSNSSLIITWVDIVLARIGQAIIVAAGTFFHVPPIDQHQPPSVRAQREDDILRVAVQLPGISSQNILFYVLIHP